MVDKTVDISVKDVRELDYLVEEKSDDAINVTGESNNASFSLDYVNKRSSIFNPGTSGTYSFELDGQKIEVNVIDLPDSVVHQYPVHSFSFSNWVDRIGSANMSVVNLSQSIFNNNSNSVSADGTEDYGSTSGVRRVFRQMRSLV